ncbi:nuclear transport factor 2 family protein [Pseudomonas mandelii]|uniref:Nuclear transport factor 2 family protein n=1 Tax=Pseudomonas mandelii TaxID=75612 RepID=A0A502ICX7_9PSED|nr:nuclear transport factor 2 family protein [Pseudomonas mandelii]TPG84761.1 nuclear transport factor 2 family protein [Pseudomonas mandelii]
MIDVAKLYFIKGDAGDLTILDLFSDDVQLYFPKFGTRIGKNEIVAFIQGLMGDLGGLKHEVEHYNYIALGNTVVVEGAESGVMKNGSQWPVEGRSEGRFCNVFEFQKKRLTMAADPARVIGAQWLNRAVSAYFNYLAVPGNLKLLSGFRKPYADTGVRISGNAASEIGCNGLASGG